MRPTVRSTLWLALLAALALPAAGAVQRVDPASARADFSGRWVPDYERWRGIERLLELQGAPWYARRGLGRVEAVEEITQTRDSLHIEVDTRLPLAVPERRYALDDRVRSEPTPFGRPSRARHYWEDADTLVHVRELEDDDGAPLVLVARRRLVAGGDAMRLEIVARRRGGAEHRALQVYRRER